MSCLFTAFYGFMSRVSNLAGSFPEFRKSSRFTFNLNLNFRFPVINGW